MTGKSALIAGASGLYSVAIMNLPSTMVIWASVIWVTTVSEMK
jgi:hypothetical protein